MANALNFNQCATLLNAVRAQATGVNAAAPVNYNEFVTVAQTTLLSGYDNVINAISQVLSKTVFSIRPYSRKFKGLHMDAARYGNHIRKLSPVDSDVSEDDRYKLTNGQAVDQQAVKKPDAVQVNFYGQEVWERHITLFKDQLDVAFSNAEEFGRFIGMIMQNVSDQIEQDNETAARATLVNFIGGKMAMANDKTDNAVHVVNLVSEYNRVHGTEVAVSDIHKPDTYPMFIKWAMGYIKTVSDMMTERSSLYHRNVSGKIVSRHTPREKQRLYMLASEINSMETGVFSSVFNENYLKTVDFEPVSFWQSIKEPDKISGTAKYMKVDGTLADAEIPADPVFAVMFDEEAAGVTTVNQWTATAPFNARGGYTNMFWHYTNRYYNDFTENGVVFLLK